ncbi:MAG: chemotaxis protein CheW [Desulfobacterales bacterium]|nr:chemotaxis protein CheW [Desulfobacterales bacterium]
MVEHRAISETGDVPETDEKNALRVNIGLLDTLMNLAGEMVLSRNQLLQGVGSTNIKTIELSSQRIDMITSELQEAIMQTRMQPIANILNRFKSKSEALARQAGKKVDIIVEGKEVELDKSILEAMSDPLIHILKNSVNNGIELPDIREKKGKDTTGRIHIKAYHEAGKVNILVSDDGQGLNPDELADTAVLNQVVTREQADNMTEKQKLELIFNPGFSIESGLHAVAGAIEHLGGAVELDAEPDKGMDILIKLPLTLAIIPSQITIAGDERYAIPQINLSELLRIPASEVKDRIEKVGDAEVIRLRGELLPLMDLAHMLGIEKTYIHNRVTGERKQDRRKNIADRRSKHHPVEDESVDIESVASNRELTQRKEEDRRQSRSSAINIAVVSSGDLKYGLIVDKLQDAEEIVVKPLGRHLKDCRAYSGATIMGDGKVALILDVGNLAQMARLSNVSKAARVGGDKEQTTETGKDKIALLTFRNGLNEHFAVPLDLVARIERVPSVDVELIGKNKVAQYRGGVIPLLEMAMAGEFAPLPDRDMQEMIVLNVKGREIGLMVTPPVDIVETTLNLDESSLKQHGIKGSMTIHGNTTLMIDVFEMVEAISA